LKGTVLNKLQKLHLINTNKTLRKILLSSSLSSLGQKKNTNLTRASALRT